MNETQDDDLVAVNQKLVDDIPITQIKMKLDAYKEFADYVNLKYNKNDTVIKLNEIKEIGNIIRLGITEARKLFIYKESSLIHKGRPPDKRVWKKLGSIASEFLKYDTYPKIEGNDLRKILNISLDSRCDRTILDYRATVLEYCNYKDEAIAKSSNSMLGTIDVTNYVNYIPKQYITTTRSTSSFEELK